MVMSWEPDGSMPSVLGEVVGAVIFTPHTVRKFPVPNTWNLAEFCRVILYSVKWFAETIWIMRGRGSRGVWVHQETVSPFKFWPPRPSITPYPIIPDPLPGRTVITGVQSEELEEGQG